MFRRIAVPPSSGWSPVGLPLILAPPPAPPQPWQFATMFDHLGHTVKVSKCASRTSQAHVLCNEGGKYTSGRSSSPSVRTFSAQFIFNVNTYFIQRVRNLINSYTVKPVRLTTFIKWPPTDVDHIAVEPAKSYIVCIYDHLHTFSTLICWIPVYVSHAKWNRGTVYTCLYWPW